MDSSNLLIAGVRRASTETQSLGEMTRERAVKWSCQKYVSMFGGAKKRVMKFPPFQYTLLCTKAETLRGRTELRSVLTPRANLV